MQSLKEFLEFNRHLSQERFLGTVPHPVLVTSRKLLTMLRQQSRSLSSHKEAGFATMPSFFTEDVSQLVFYMPDGWYIPVKSQREGIMQIINVGRTPNNDIVIPLSPVSKFHCCILVFGPDNALILDGGSSNGTYLNGFQLVPRERNPLKSGDVVRLAKILEFEFFFPEAFFSLMADFWRHATL